MGEPKRFIVGYRYGPRMDPASMKDLEAFVGKGDGARSVRKTGVGRHVVMLTEEQSRELQRSNRDLIVEEDQKVILSGMPGLASRVPAGGPFSLSVSVKDAKTGTAISDVTVYGVGEGVAYKAVTDKKGQAVIETRENALQRIIASPRDTYWSRVIPDVAVGSGQKEAMEITLEPLITGGIYDWGHAAMGFHRVRQYWTGKGVRVGVIDSGISTQNSDLAPAGGYNTLDGADPKTWNDDEIGHGTHVGGILAARGNTQIVTGCAPEAEVYSAKIFPGGYLSDLVEAMEWCIKNGMAVISMSLGIKNPSRILSGVMRDAYDRGIACIAAVGNEKGEVSYPAAFPTVMGVSALGRVNTFPQDSASALTLGRVMDGRGIFFSPNFNNYGQEVDVCAPGVAVMSTVPTGYAAWDGTSMACPMVSGLAALILQAYPAYRTGDPSQAEFVKTMLVESAFDLGMPPEYQGAGLPLAPLALGNALPGSRRGGGGWPKPDAPAEEKKERQRSGRPAEKPKPES